MKPKNGLRTRTHALFAAATVTAGVAATMLAGQPAAHASAQARASGTQWGCDFGWVCIYAEEETVWQGHITDRYFKYGTYNLQNQFNYHDIVNNQSDHATVTLCYGFNGTNCDSRPLLTYDDCGCSYGINLTPINSIKLNRP